MEKAFSLFFSLILLLIILPIVQAQQLVAPDWVRTVSGWWIIFLFLAFFLLAAAYVAKGTTGRAIMIVGTIFLFMSIVSVLVGVLLPLFGKPVITYEECKTMFKPDVSFFTVPGLFYTFSCVLTGYSPAELGWLNITTFVIFGVIAPFALLSILFLEFVPEGLIPSIYARRVIAFIAALFAFRGLFATFFIDMLSYGFLGIGALLIAVLFTGFVWKIAYRFTMPLGVPIKTELRYFMLGEAEQIRREITQLEAALAAAPLADRPRIQDRINALNRRLAELERRGR